jgi:hypothetical protein
MLEAIHGVIRALEAARQDQAGTASAHGAFLQRAIQRLALTAEDELERLERERASQTGQ